MIKCFSCKWCLWSWTKGMLSFRLVQYYTAPKIISHRPPPEFFWEAYLSRCKNARVIELTDRCQRSGRSPLYFTSCIFNYLITWMNKIFLLHAYRWILCCFYLSLQLFLTVVNACWIFIDKWNMNVFLPILYLSDPLNRNW